MLLEMGPCVTTQVGAGIGAMSDPFTARKFAWLEAVARDGDLRASASRLAIILAGFFNRKSGDAWPSMDTLADILGMTRRGVQKSVEARDIVVRDAAGGVGEPCLRIKLSTAA